MISAVVLAAGTSSRMGQPKPLIVIGGRPLLARVLDTVRRSSADEVVVVLGHEAERIQREVPLDGASVVVNRDYAEGMSTSIRAGIRASDPEADGFLIVLGDQLFVSRETLDALIEAKERGRAKIVIPTFRGRRGNPVLLDRSLAGEVPRISGDIGCRAIFPDHEDEIAEVPVEDPGILVDLDTLGQVERARDTIAGRTSLESLVEETSPLDRPADDSTTRMARKPRESVDILGVAYGLRSRDEPFVLATVVRASRPTSGKPGFKAIVRPSREILGWVGGTCAESVLVKESLAALRDGRPRLMRLSKNPSLSRHEEGVVEYAMECHSGGAMEIYIEPHLPKPRLVIAGPSPVAEALSSLGRLLGYRVTVVAPEAEASDFPEADQVVSDVEKISGLVTGETYAVVATMAKYDEMALRSLAASTAAYVGLVASRRRAEVVKQELRRAGLADEAVERIRSPAGLDLGAETPEEIALSIMAEITNVRRTAGSAEKAEAEARTQAASTKAPVDVVCGMAVDPTTPLKAVHGGKTYFFCSESCRARFLESPEAFLQ